MRCSRRAELVKNNENEVAKKGHLNIPENKNGKHKKTLNHFSKNSNFNRSLRRVGRTRARTDSRHLVRKPTCSIKSGRLPPPTQYGQCDRSPSVRTAPHPVRPPSVPGVRSKTQRSKTHAVFATKTPSCLKWKSFDRRKKKDACGSGAG